MKRITESMQGKEEMKGIMEDEHFEIIGGADGPTSIFICDKSKKQTLSQRLMSFLYRIKRWFIEKSIRPGVHSLDEVEEYIKSRYGFVEVDRTEFEFEYEETRTAFLFKYRSDLAQGRDIDLDFDITDDAEEMLIRLNEKIKKEKEIADSIPRDVFDIDFHKYVKKGKDNDDSMHIIIEKNNDYLAAGAQGSKKFMKMFNSVYKDIYKYYGVSEEDIQNKTERYKDLVIELSR